MKTTVVIGAGISGLSLAWYIRQKNPSARVIVVDAKERVGGVIGTIQGRFFFEKGPRTFPTHRSRALLDLIGELGLEEELLYTNTRGRYIYYGERLHPFPSTLFEFFRSPLTHGIWSAVFRDLTCRRVGNADESVRSFFARHLGEILTDRLIVPIFNGIYAGDIDQLSILSTMPFVKQWEEQYRSLIKGLWKHRRASTHESSLFTLRGGLESFCNVLSRRSESEFLPNFCVEEVVAHGDKVYVSDRDRTIEADWVFSSLQPACLAKKSLCTVNIAFEQRLTIPKGFGYLTSGEQIKGVVFDSVVFPEQNSSLEETRLTVMMDCQSHPEKIALESIKKHLGIDALPTQVHVHDYYQAIVQPRVHHREEMERLLPKHRRIIPFGTHLSGPSVNACVANAQRLVQSLCAVL